MGQRLLSRDPNWGAAAEPSTPAAVADVPRDARGMPAVSSAVSEQPSGFAEMFGPLAHPETFTDFARLLTLPVDAVKKAAASALALSAARSAPAAVAHAATKAPGVVGNAMAATGRGMERVGTAVEKPLGTAGIVDLVTSGNPVRSAAIAAAPKVVQFAGRGLQRAGSALAAERAAVAPVAAEVAEVAPAAQAATNALPDQRALNEAALAVRRAAYQASRTAEATASPAASAAETASTVSKFRLSAPEAKDYIALIKQGKTRQQAMQTIEAAREFAKRFGLQTPTAAETRFPKGMRGKVPPS